MRRRGIALVVAAVALAGCGGGDDERAGTTSSSPSVGRFLDRLPVGYRYAPAPKPSAEKAFREKIARDFDADEVDTRNVYVGAQFVAGVAAVRAGRQFSVAEIADTVAPGHLPVAATKIHGKRAHVVAWVGPDGEADVAVVDKIGSVVLIVTADRYRVAREVAAPMVR